jgi:hypothetical protein
MSEKKPAKKTLSAKERHQKKLEALAKLEALEPEVKKEEEKMPVQAVPDSSVEPVLSEAPAAPVPAEAQPDIPTLSKEDLSTSVETSKTPEVTPTPDPIAVEVKTPAASSESVVSPSVESPMTLPVQEAPSLDTLKTVELQTDDGRGAKKKFLLIVLAIILLTFAVLGGAYFFMQSSQAPKSSPKTEVTQAPLPSPTAEPTPDITSVKIDVLNGSGIRGEAARLQELLEEEGYTINTVGNADGSDYTQTIIQVKDTVSEEIVSQLEDVLKESYDVGKSEKLASSESADIVIIIGSEKSAQ